MALRRHSSPDMVTNGTRAQSTPLQQPSVFLPPAPSSSPNNSRLSAMTQPFRRPQFERANTRLDSSLLPTAAQPRPPSSTPTTAATALAYLAPHSPAVTRASRGGGVAPRQASASMRGTPAAQQSHTANYASRIFSGSAATARPSRPLEKSNSLSSSGTSNHTSNMNCTNSPQSTQSGSDSPLYYVVGNAVVNPQLMVSPSVQGEVRGVASLAALPDARRRPLIGPQLHNTNPASTTEAATSQKDDVVVRVEGIHTRRTPAPESLPYVQQATEARAGSLAVLRHLYGTTAEDVIEIAQTNPRSGTLEPPRMQYHLAQELLPELTSSEAQLKAMHNARRRIDWDVNIPTAATLPPPAITFTTANGTPVTTLGAIALSVDASTLVLQRDHATEKTLSTPLQDAGFGVGAGGSAFTATRVGSAAGTKVSSPFLDEERVGLEISREDRIGSSGLFRVRHLVALRQGLGEMVGLERVLEYEVKTAAPELFLVQPYISANSGDLCMELNTSLQGTAKLTITGVDCGSVDPETGNVQRSSNTLVVYVTLKHDTNTAATAITGAALRERSLVSSSMSGTTAYACVPSALPNTRAPSAGANAAGRGNGALGHSGSRDHPPVDQQGSDAFSLSLAHFSQEFAAAEHASSRNPSLSRDSAGAATPVQDNALMRPAPRRHSLDVQSVAARTAAAAAEAGGVSGGSPTAAVSGAFTRSAHRGHTASAGRRPRLGAALRESGPASPAPHFLFPLTNPHALRYRHCTEALRLRRLQQYTRQQDKHKDEEAQRKREVQMAAAAAASAAAPNNIHPVSSMINGSHSAHPQQHNNNNNTANANNWSDEEDEKEMSREPSEESPSRGRTSSTTSNGQQQRRSRRKSVVEILELEEEFDHNNPVAMPTVTSMQSNGSNQSSGNGGRRSAAHARGSDAPFSSTGPLFHEDNSGGSSGGGADVVVCELRRPRIPNSLFFLDTIQSPVSYMRLTVWQDRLLLLFRAEDKELLRSDERARCKREARQELTEGTLAGMLSSTFAWSANPGTSIGGRKLSMQGRRSSAVFSSRNSNNNYSGATVTASGSGGGNGDSSRGNSPFTAAIHRGSGLNRPTSGSSSGGGASASAEKPFEVIRRLILCLALEEERSSVQLYADTIQLCSHLCHSALLKTINLTRGTREGLQQAAAAVLSAGSPMPSPKGKLTPHPIWEGNSTLSAADRDSLRQLSETLELAMTVLLLIGAYGSAVEYAVQRVHALCLLEGDTTALVNAAQRDLAEVYLFYGDYSTAVTIAEDVVMLSEQLCADTPDAYEVAEAEALCTLACVAAGRRERLPHYITRLEMNVLPLDHGADGVASVPLPLLQAQLRLVLGFAKLYMAHSAPTDGSSGQTAILPGGTAAVVPLVREAVRLLRGDGDLQEMEQSFSTVFPSQARFAGNLEGSSANIPLSVRGRLASMVSCSITAGPQPINRSAADLNSGETTMKMMAAQKRLRWNLLSFAGALLVQSEETREGIEVMENTVKELVLGQHRYVERNHRASIAATLWVGLVLCKSYAQPSPKDDFGPMLKEVANRVVRIKGPLHPFAAAANLQYANVEHHSLNGRHGLSLAARSLAVLENAVSAQSHYLMIGHYIVGSMAESQQRWRLGLEHLSAAYGIAQTNHFCTRDLMLLETRLLGALLSCPPTAVVDVDTTRLRAHVETRLAAVRQRVGPHDELLVEPLWNVAEVHYLAQQPTHAVECLQQAVRLLDRRGVLLASADVLRPVDVLRIEKFSRESFLMTSAEDTSVEQLVQQRNAVVQTSFDSVMQALRLANTLFMLAAVFESQARVAEAQEKYSQCLAIFEALNLADATLSAAHVVTALAKLLYTKGECGDALSWAHKAEHILHTHYRKQWPLELEAAEKLVVIVEQRLYDEEGTYVVQNDEPSADGLPRLL